MTQQEQAEFEAYKVEKEHQALLDADKARRAQYLELVDQKIEAIVPKLRQVSDTLSATKTEVYDEFMGVLSLKSDIMNRKTDENKTHTFSNVKGDKRITLGSYYIDSYLDTVDDGIEMVKDYLASLAKDEDSRALVKVVLKLLSKDSQGTLKASRVLQLRKMASESGNDRFIEGVKIIEEAYRPEQSKTFVKAEYKNEKGKWINIPLGMTEA